MAWFNDLKVGTKILVTVTIILALMAFQGIFSIIQTSKVNKVASEIRNNWLPSIKLLAEIDGNINEIRRIELANINAKTKEEHDSFDKRNKAAKEKYAKQTIDYEKLVSSDDEKKLFELTKSAITSYLAVNAEVSRLIDQGKMDEAYPLNRTESRSTFGVLQESIKKLIEYNHKGANADGQKADRLYASAIKMIIAILVAAMAIGILMAFFVARAISRPLQDIAAKAELIANGDLNITVISISKDEVGQLGVSFAKMINNLRDVISQVRETSNQVASSAIELSSTSEQIATGSEEVAAQAGTVATATEEMSATTSDIARNCHDAADSATRASKSAQAGSGVVEQTVFVMNRIATKVKETAEKVDTLGRQSDQIGEIVGTIEDIADQTNLLALNAAIEAARAGEQGRGFAVVADEVRALAERTTKATKEIGDMIKNIQSETKQAVIAMEEGVREVANGTTEAEKSGHALQDILNLANAVTEQVSQIATAAEEQTATTQEITNNIHQINGVVQTSALSAQQSASAANQLSEMAEALKTLVSRFKLSA